MSGFGAGRRNQILLSTLLVVVVHCFQVAESGSLSVRSVEDDLWKQLGSVHGSSCIADQDCAAIISFCHHESSALPGQCNLIWWFILVLVLIGLAVVSSIVSCLCCPCCCLFAVGKRLCCCCPERG